MGLSELKILFFHESEFDLKNKKFYQFHDLKKHIKKFYTAPL